jgi:peptide/nickel transport system substrate-binding protein
VFRNAALDGPPHLDPHLTTNAVTWGFGVGLWYSRLIKFDVFAPQPAVKLVPDLAESWDQPDDLTYLFKLRPNVKWQNLPPVNGRALTIDDILYSFERMRSPSSPNASLLAVVAKMEAVDRTTFKVTLTQPMADFLINVGSVGNAIVARENVEQKGDLREGPVVGTGPFIVDKVDRQGVSTLVRNPDYFLPGKPYLDSYQYGPLPDSATLLAAFRAGNLDLIPPGILTPTEAETLKRANPAFQFPTYRSYSGTELALRSDRPPFHDVRIRQAVYKAVDSEAIIKAAFGAGKRSAFPCRLRTGCCPRRSSAGSTSVI